MNGLAGSVTTMPLRDLFLYLGSHQLSGMLQCEDGDDRKTLTIAAGVAVMASSTHPHEHFSYMLVEKGHIGQDKLDLAMQQAPSGSLGRTLVTKGYLAESVVREALVAKIHRTLVTLTDWSSGTFQFIESEADEEPAGVDAMIDLLAFWHANGRSLSHEALEGGWQPAQLAAGAVEEAPKTVEPSAEAAQFAAKFRREVKARLAARGRGKRFPKDLQARAVKHYWARIRQGSFLSEVARELGLPPPTLRRWVLDAPLSAMEGKASAQWKGAKVDSTTTPGAPVLVGPNGLRVEGLDLDTLTALLRRLDLPH